MSRPKRKREMKCPFCGHVASSHVNGECHCGCIG